MTRPGTSPLQQAHAWGWQRASFRTRSCQWWVGKTTKAPGSNEGVGVAGVWASAPAQPISICPFRRVVTFMSAPMAPVMWPKCVKTLVHSDMSLLRHVCLPAGDALHPGQHLQEHSP
jgi:hypothetical protein